MKLILLLLTLTSISFAGTISIEGTLPSGVELSSVYAVYGNRSPSDFCSAKTKLGSIKVKNSHFKAKVRYKKGLGGFCYKSRRIKKIVVAYHISRKEGPKLYHDGGSLGFKYKQSHTFSIPVDVDKGETINLDSFALDCTRDYKDQSVSPGSLIFKYARGACRNNQQELRLPLNGKSRIKDFKFVINKMPDAPSAPKFLEASYNLFEREAIVEVFRDFNQNMNSLNFIKFSHNSTLDIPNGLYRLDEVWLDSNTNEFLVGSGFVEIGDTKRPIYFKFTGRLDHEEVKRRNIGRLCNENDRGVLLIASKGLHYDDPSKKIICFQ